MLIEWAPYTLDFVFEARTSRETMRHKQTWFVRITDRSTGRVGIGECPLFRGLSAEDSPRYEEMLADACRHPERPLPEASSIRFGLETARINAGLTPGYDTPFTRGEGGIKINGLIWMGDKATMRQRIDEKVKDFGVLKLKIGGIDFDAELDLLRYIRQRYSSDCLEIRLDANGSFKPDEALSRIEQLAKYGIHSIEQPVKAGQYNEMARICRDSDIPVALDEELIGVNPFDGAAPLLDELRPQYIILKPALCGGIGGADVWADAAESLGIGWWATSALESDVGLHAIASWVSSRTNSLPQGLGTGRLYSNNVASPLELRGEKLWYNPLADWKFPDLEWRR